MRPVGWLFALLYFLAPAHAITAQTFTGTVDVVDGDTTTLRSSSTQQIAHGCSGT